MKKDNKITIKEVDPSTISIGTEYTSFVTDKKAMLQNHVDLLNTKNSTIYFYMIDCRGNASGSIANIYVMASMLEENGYKVAMIYQPEKDEDWVGPIFMADKYNKLTHIPISQVNTKISDFLIIPEIFVSLKKKNEKEQIESLWKGLPCKKIVLCQTFNFLTEAMPIGENFSQLGLMDVITTTETQKRLLLEIMPYLKVEVVEPSIAPVFYKSSEQKKLQIAIVSKEREDVNKIAKLFVLKYPMFKFLSFKHLTNLNQELFAEEIRNSVAMVWADRQTNFGYAALEAVKCGTIVIGLIPDEPVEWQLKEDTNEMSSSILWIDNMNKVHGAILAVVSSFMEDHVPERIEEEMEKLSTRFKREDQSKRIVFLMDNYFKTRIKDITEAIGMLGGDKKEEETINE
jgi:hypothetical protein